MNTFRLTRPPPGCIHSGRVQAAIADVMACNDEKHQRLDATIDKLRAR